MCLRDVKTGWIKVKHRLEHEFILVKKQQKNNNNKTQKFLRRIVSRSQVIF